LNWCDRTSDGRLALVGCATLDRAAALPAKFIGRVYATDAAEAIKLAIKEHKLLQHSCRRS
jgi:hypothetical protein